MLIIISKFSSKIQGFFKKLGVDINMPQLSLIAERDFVKGGTTLSPDEIDQAREQAGMMAGISAPGISVADALSNVASNASSASSAMTNFPSSVPAMNNTTYNVEVTAPPLTDPVAVGKEVEKVLQAVEQSQGKVNITARRATSSFRVVPI